MSVQSKRRRRIAALLIVLLVFGAALGGYAVWHRSQKRTELADMRSEGLALFENEQYFMAMHTLGRYLRQSPDDVEVMYAYYQARINVPVTGGGHLRDAAKMLKRLLDLDPDHPTAARELFDLCVKVRYHLEAIDLADKFLVEDPDDAQAVRGKLLALVGTRRFDEAIAFADAQLREGPTGQPLRSEAVRAAAAYAKALAFKGNSQNERALEWAQRYNALEPLDLEGHLLTFQLMVLLERPMSQLVDHAQQVHSEHPDDAKTELALAIAYRLAERREDALRWLGAVAQRQLEDESLIARLVDQLDRLDQYQQAIAVLERAHERIESIGLRHVLIRRLIQSGKQQQALTLLERDGLDHTSPVADTGLLAFKALALLQVDRHAEARPIIETLVSRSKDDSVADAWVPFLRLIATPADQRTPLATKEICQTALSVYEGNPFFLVALGQALWSLGESDLAIQRWQEARMLARSWSKPWQLLSQAWMERNEVQLAMLAAQEAAKRRPEESQPAADTPPDQGPSALQVFLLARSGKTQEARSSLEALLAGGEKFDERMLLELTSISRNHGLGLEEQCLQRYEQLHGLTPALAYERSIWWMSQGQAQKGLETLEDAIASSTTGKPIAWKLARAQYLDAITDPSATARWAAVGDEFSDHLGAQRQVLRSPSAWKDLGLIDRTIDRVTALTGEDGVQWRVARARWILEKDLPDHDKNRAVDLLNDVIKRAPTRVDAYVLLARCYLALDNPTAAIEQLSAAARLDKDSPQIAVDLARLYLSRGENERARQHLSVVAQNRDRAPELVLRIAAGLYERLGDTDAAIALLEDKRDGPHEAGGGDLALAQLYLRRNEHEKVEAIIEKLLNPPTADGVRFASVYLASRGQMEKARQTLDLLDPLPLPPGQREVIRAQFLARFAGVEEAVQAFEAALAAAPRDAAIWRQWIQYLTVTGKTDEAVDAADEAATAIPDDEILHDFAQHKDLVSITAVQPQLRPIAADLLADDTTRLVAAEVLTLLVEAERESRPIAEVLGQLRPIVEANPTYLDLQVLMVQLLMRVGENSTAADLAERGLQVAPDNPRFAQLHARALASTDRLDRALTAANRWRRLVADQPLEADLLIAEVQLQRESPAAAARTIQPYLDQALENPEAYANLIGLQARIWLGLGRPQEVNRVLSPLLNQSPAWRRMWIRLALSRSVSPDTAADWLTRVENQIPDGELAEKVVLIQGWLALANMTGSQPYTQRAIEMLDTLVEHPQAPTSAWLTLALACEQVRQLQRAEHAYRKVLQLQPDTHVAQNNLAMVLARKDENLEEARILAQSAIDHLPHSANYRDTLAVVLAKAGDYPAAIAAMREAVQLEPQNPIWRENLEQLISDSAGADASTGTGSVEPAGAR